ncbi:putative nuclease HARBI1 [Zophobas morio]|uniref:putative nuclease HARBI1 n=1 Tax=Zophobas morio TaxID=2755281 RepID=UPI0030838A03
MLKKVKISKEFGLKRSIRLTCLIFVLLNCLGLTTRTKLLAALRFFAGGSYQLDVGGNYTVGLSQPSVSRAIHEIIDAFNTPFMLYRFIKFPQTIEELTNIRQRFFIKFGLPGIIGCIDGTHVSIVTPIENEHLYINRKRYHSLNVQIICDEELKITNVNARFPGSTHDSFVWQNSNIFTFLRDLPREHRGSYYLLGESGYPLRASLYRKPEYAPWAANIQALEAEHSPKSLLSLAWKSTNQFVIEDCCFLN